MDENSLFGKNYKIQNTITLTFLIFNKTFAILT